MSKKQKRALAALKEKLPQLRQAPDEGIILGLDQLDSREYTVNLPITMDLSWWLNLRMAAASKGISMAELAGKLICSDEMLDLVNEP